MAQMGQKMETLKGHVYIFSYKILTERAECLKYSANIIGCLKLNTNIISARVDLVPSKNVNDLV